MNYLICFFGCRTYTEMLCQQPNSIKQIVIMALALSKVISNVAETFVTSVMLGTSEREEKLVSEAKELVSLSLVIHKERRS